MFLFVRVNRAVRAPLYEGGREDAVGVSDAAGLNEGDEGVQVALEEDAEGMHFFCF